MTSRERVQNFLNGKPADCIPNGLGGCETAGLHNVAYHKLKRLLGVNDPANRVCTFMNNAIFEPAVLKAMGGDVILLGSRMCPARFWGPEAAAEWKSLPLWDIDLQVAQKWQFRKTEDGGCWWDERTFCPAGAYYFDPPVASRVGKDFAVAEFPTPEQWNPSHELPDALLRRLEADAKWLYENTDYAISCGEFIQDLQLRPGGTQSWWMQMVAEPEVCHEFLDKAVDVGLAHLKQLNQAVGKYCETLLIADDMGDTRGITIGPDLWRRIYKPHYKRLFTEWHRMTKMKVSLHTCGSMSEILGDLIECGVDIFNPVQISANRMHPADLKKKFGDQIIFYGGVYDAVAMGKETSAAAVYEAVKNNIRIFSQNGGYLFSGVHNLPPEIPEAHLQAMLQAYQDCYRDPALIRKSA